jgi:hypothetical protein
MVFNSPVNDELWLVHGPLPLCPDGIGVMPPAENTLVGASQTWRSLHATVGLDSVEGVLKFVKIHLYRRPLTAITLVARSVNVLGS